MTIAVIGVPTSAGSHGPGQEKAPQALRRAGRVADHVRAALDRGQRPLVLGGDCTITLGVVAGFARHGGDLGLLYFDGDADLSTPATSRSGVLDSMGVAHLLGEGAPALAGIGPRTPLLAPDRLLLFGFDDPDDLGEPQQALLARHAPAAWPATRARAVPGGPRAAAAAALAELEARSGTVLVHFDVDVVDSGDLPLANFPHFGQGLSLTDAFACLEAFLASPKLGGLVVTEVNPDHDPGGQLGRLVDGLVAALAQQGPRSPPLPTIRS